ncbi:MAG: hypothetical protein K6C99_04255 [Lachnospiraceae bacterium]|nr:hypothetical protein [Lachnospiraceae bacterium]
MKLVVFIVAAVFVILFSMWMIVSPQSYRDYLSAHPGMDKSGNWENASDGKIRITGIAIIAAMLACIAVILKMIGVL